MPILMLPMGIYFNCVYELLMHNLLFLTRKNLECVHKLTNVTRNERTNYTNETQTNGKRTNDTCKQKRYKISNNLTIQGLYAKTRADNS